VFDNSLGRVGGQWNQYSEISVARARARRQSDYYINGQHVRRRDITFLGTAPVRGHRHPAGDD
jgi:chromosome segregation protein